MDRRSRVLANLKLDGLGLEIGGSFSPFAAGDPRLRVKSLDHLDQAGLVAKYSSDATVDVSRIQPVDYVWTGQSYPELVGNARFDWIIASHVIEHVPDLIGFVNECAEILTPDGVLSLVVPDKRFVFDYFRPPTGIGRLVDAHVDRRRTTSAGSVVENLLNQARLEGGHTWSAGVQGEVRNGADFAWTRHALEEIERGEYVDAHAWVFTPHSFRLAVHDLHALDMLQLQESTFHDSVGCEFFIQLSRHGAGATLDRERMSRLALEELTVLTHPPAMTAGRSIPEVAAENLALRQSLDQVLRSNSWRLTAPLRALRRGLGPSA